MKADKQFNIPNPPIKTHLVDHLKYATVLLLYLLALIATGCVTSFDRQRGRYHTFTRGDDFWRIAKVYRIDPQRLAEYNNIEDPHGIMPGTKIYIPPKPETRGYKRLPIGKVDKEFKFRKGREDKHRPSKMIYTDHGRFIWPVDGKLTRGFGIHEGRRHDGIDISAPKGTPIKAADSGEVVFADRLKGYGLLVIIKHKDGFYTAYGHCSKILCNKGDKIKRGQIIAKVGNTGRSTGNHLHFEVREGQMARNPLFFLPKRS